MKINKLFKIILLVFTVFIVISIIVIWGRNTQVKPAYALDNIEVAKQEDYNKCVIVRKEKASLKLEKLTSDFDYSTVENELPNKLKGVDNLNIICTKYVKYNDLIKVLDAIALSGMKKYKLLKM